MKVFKDVNGKEWSLAINTNSLKRCIDLAEFDLLKLADDPKSLSEIDRDPVKLVAALYAICKPQADTANVTPEAFGEALGSGDVMEAATDALLHDLFSFFPKHRREALMKALHKLKQCQDKAAVLLMQRLDSPELNQKLEAILNKAINQPLPDAGD